MSRTVTSTGPTVTADGACCCGSSGPGPCCGYNLASDLASPPGDLPLTLTCTIETFYLDGTPVRCPWVDTTFTLAWSGRGWSGTGHGATYPGTPHPACADSVMGSAATVYVGCGGRYGPGWNILEESFPAGFTINRGDTTQCPDQTYTRTGAGCDRPILLQNVFDGVRLGVSMGGVFPCCPFGDGTGQECIKVVVTVAE